MCDEDVTYLGYFSSQEKMIQQVLQEQSDVAQTHLKGVVHRAAIHCRRDSLWSSLLPRSLKDENSSKEVSLCYIMFRLIVCLRGAWANWKISSMVDPSQESGNHRKLSIIW